MFKENRWAKSVDNSQPRERRESERLKGSAEGKKDRKDCAEQ